MTDATLSAEQRVSESEFDMFIALPENSDRRFELILGEIFEVPSNPLSSEIAGEFAFHIRLFLRDNKIAGHVTGEAGGYRVMGERYAPDVAFISAEKQAELPYDDQYNPIPPDLVVEVISPSDNMRNLRIKISNYLAAGVTVWLCDPVEPQVEVHHPAKPVQIIGIDGELDGGDVLPGFKLRLSEIFPNKAKKAE